MQRSLIWPMGPKLFISVYLGSVGGEFVAIPATVCSHSNCIYLFVLFCKEKRRREKKTFPNTVRMNANTTPVCEQTD